MTTNSDRAIEHLLRQSLAEPSGAGATPACLDAETLAAWVDGGLSDSEQALAEAHASDCARCQALLATMTRAAGAPVVAKAWWQRGWHLGWMVPVAAGAAALALWVAVPNRTALFVSETPVVQPATPAPSAEPKKGEESERRADAPPAGAPGEKLRSTLAAAVPTDARPAEEAASKAKNTAVRDENAASKDERDARLKTAPAEQNAVADSLAKSAAPAAVPTPPAAPAPAVAAAPPVTAARAQEAATARKEAAAVAEPLGRFRQFAAPNSSVRWRVGQSGLVQRSADGGSAWEVLPTGVTADLLAASSPSPSVCWVVGRAATVLVAVDGRRFTRVSFPEVVDLTAVQAADARTAEVTTADGRTFSTVNGGASWNQK